MYQSIENVQPEDDEWYLRLVTRVTGDYGAFGTFVSIIDHFMHNIEVSGFIGGEDLMML